MPAATPRLTRRIAILSGKRSARWNADQGWFEQAPRTRAARSLRARIRRGEPIVLVAPRWSEPAAFLADLAADLAVGTPAVHARTLFLGPLAGRTNPQAWTWILMAAREAMGLPPDPRATSAASSRGFQGLFRAALDAGEAQPDRRALLLHGIENIDVEVLTDLVEVVADHHAARVGLTRRVTTLFCGGPDMAPLELSGHAPTRLVDAGHAEAMEVLSESTEALSSPAVEAAARQLGGVPGFLAAFAKLGPDALTAIASEPRAFWKLGGPLADDVRTVVQIANADPTLGARLDQIARHGPLRIEPETDRALMRSGLVAPTAQSPGWVALRSPRFGDIV